MKNYTFRYPFKVIKEERDLLVEEMVHLCSNRNLMCSPMFNSCKESLKESIRKTVQLDSPYCLSEASEGSDETNKKFTEYFTEFESNEAELVFNMAFNELIWQNKNLAHLNERIKRLEERKKKNKNSKYAKLVELREEIRKEEENEFPFRKY